MVDTPLEGSAPRFEAGLTRRRGRDAGAPCARRLGRRGRVDPDESGFVAAVRRIPRTTGRSLGTGTSRSSTAASNRCRERTSASSGAPCRRRATSPCDCAGCAGATRTPRAILVRFPRPQPTSGPTRPELATHGFEVRIDEVGIPGATCIYTTGAILNEPVQRLTPRAARPPMEWNDLEITVRGAALRRRPERTAGHRCSSIPIPPAAARAPPTPRASSACSSPPARAWRFATSASRRSNLAAVRRRRGLRDAQPGRALTLADGPTKIALFRTRRFGYSASRRRAWRAATERDEGACGVVGGGTARARFQSPRPRSRSATLSGQHLHRRDPGRAGRRRRAGRALRRRLGERRPGRRRLRRLRPAPHQRGRAAGHRVSGQHLHLRPAGRAGGEQRAGRQLRRRLAGLRRQHRPGRLQRHLRPPIQQQRRTAGQRVRGQPAARRLRGRRGGRGDRQRLRRGVGRLRRRLRAPLRQRRERRRACRCRSTRTTLGFQGTAGVAATPDGGFVVAWEADVSGGDGTDYDVFARRFNASGGAVGTEFQVNTTTSGYQYAPSIAATTDGGFVVAWASYASPGAYRGVFGRRFDGSSAPLGSEFPIHAAAGHRRERTAGRRRPGRQLRRGVDCRHPARRSAPRCSASASTPAGTAVGSVAMVDNTAASAFQPSVVVRAGRPPRRRLAARGRRRCRCGASSPSATP